ncbi:DUF29 domain-containing protein [Salmonella enterica]|nr:DUF29 domain-containing protein [Salmonella enterica]
MHASYDTDFYAWIQEQTALLRAGKLNELDTANLIEEIESMGKKERRELLSRITLLLAHLLKWKYQPSHSGSSWRNTIAEQRREIPKILKDSPSLKRLVPEFFAEGYEDARKWAQDETGLPLATFPEVCPWTYDEAMTVGYYPQ